MVQAGLHGINDTGHLVLPQYSCSNSLIGVGGSGLRYASKTCFILASFEAGTKLDSKTLFLFSDIHTWLKSP